MILPSISIVIPCYNSAQTLPILLDRIRQTFSTGVNNYEVILIDDDSRDGTWATIQQLATSASNVSGFRMMRNYGQHNAVLCGIRAAAHEVIVTLDDDLQTPPEEAPKLVALLMEGYDVVYGTPEHEQHGIWRDVASLVTKAILQNAMGARTARDVSAFRAFRTRLRDAFSGYQAPYVSIDVLLTWATTRFTAMKVKHHPRTIGKSNYTFGKLLNVALTLLTGFSILPLRIASLMGFVCTGVGFILFLYVLVRYLTEGRSVPGFAFLATAITVFSGLQLFALGIIGEYLARMYVRMMNQPSYTVVEKAWSK